MAATVKRSALTKDWLVVPKTWVGLKRINAGGPLAVLDAQPVSIAVVSVGTSPVSLDWVEAEWIGEPGTARAFRAMFGPGTGSQQSHGAYQVWGRIVDPDWTLAEPAFDLDVI